MQKWEYKKIWRERETGKDPLSLSPGSGPVYKWGDYPDDEDQRKHKDEMSRLKELGDEGWELVSVVYRQEGRKTTYTYYLKRAIE